MARGKLRQMPNAAAHPPLTSSLWMARIRSLAASQLLFLPVMTIVSESLFSVGRSILVLVSSRIWRQQPHR